MVDQNDSIIVLSTEDATRPMEPSRPASRSRWPRATGSGSEPNHPMRMSQGTGSSGNNDSDRRP
jgi:hypothetical protein